jgi:hypothetical protein
MSMDNNSTKEIYGKSFIQRGIPITSNSNRGGGYHSNLGSSTSTSMMASSFPGTSSLGSSRGVISSSDKWDYIQNAIQRLSETEWIFVPEGFGGSMMLPMPITTLSYEHGNGSECPSPESSRTIKNV